MSEFLIGKHQLQWASAVSGPVTQPVSLCLFLSDLILCMTISESLPDNLCLILSDSLPDSL